MDPITVYRLSLIRQQEIVEECLNDQGSSFEIKARVVSLWERLSAVVRNGNSRDEQPCGESFAASH